MIESQSPPATVSREQAVAAAKQIEFYVKLFGDEDRMSGQVQASVLDYAETLAAYVLQFTPAEAFDARAFVRRVMHATITWYEDEKSFGMEANDVLNPFTAELCDLIAAQGRAGDAWLPIETAPKDGTRIIIPDGLHSISVVKWIGSRWCHWNMNHFDDMEWMTAYVLDVAVWMPYIEPPAIPSPTPATE